MYLLLFPCIGGGGSYAFFGSLVCAASVISNFPIGPIFVIQWIYDLAQIREDNPELGKNPMLLGGKEYFPYMTFLGQRVRQSLSTVR